jgi:[FeFe] hydrogenase H-cluster maturation GTPase HydF
LNNIPKSERKHIVIVGRRNAGKSSLVNALLGQDLSIVSEIPGTTTDPVIKAMELLPFGPVALVDTAGIDDDSPLGEKRIQKTNKAIASADFVLLVIEASHELTGHEHSMISLLHKADVPFLAVLNKSDLGVNKDLTANLNNLRVNYFPVSCIKSSGIYELKEKLVKLLPEDAEPPLVGDLVKQGDTIVLVVPIDLGAPKGRLILPQVQTIRESLDEDAVVIVCKDKELRSVLGNLKNEPKLVVTDSQAIMRVNADVPENIPLTTFSIIMARKKGDLPEFVKGIMRVDELQSGDKVLIAEACSHHAQEDDIGKVKIPRWLRLHTKKDLDIEVKSGIDFPEDLNEYKLIVHCGGCMLTRKSMQNRIKEARLAGVPIVNYGVLISYMHGAAPRALLPFPDAVNVWNKIKKVSF